MTDSLGTKIHNLPISPINYHSSQSGGKQLKAVFSNLKYKPTSMSIDGDLMNFNLPSHDSS